MFEFELDSASLQYRSAEDERHETAFVLATVYKERAREEALMRAIVAERADNRTDAEFWVSVYAVLLKATRAESCLG